MKVYARNGGIAPLIRNFVTRRNFTPRPLYPWNNYMNLKYILLTSSFIRMRHVVSERPIDRHYLPQINSVGLCSSSYAQLCYHLMRKYPICHSYLTKWDTWRMRTRRNPESCIDDRTILELWGWRWSKWLVNYLAVRRRTNDCVCVVTSLQ